MERTDDGEMAAVERGDRVLLEALGDCDDGGVDQAQAEVGVLDHQVERPLVVLAIEVDHEHLLLEMFRLVMILLLVAFYVLIINLNATLDTLTNEIKLN